MTLLLGIDIGTSAVKGVLCRPGEGIVREAEADYPLSRPREGWSEQDPADWWSRTVRVIRSLLAERAGAPAVDAREIAGVSFSGQMHGAVLLSGDAVQDPLSRIVRPAILWNDQRAVEDCLRIEAEAGDRTGLVRLVGNAALPGFTLPKLMWVARHEPAAWSRVSRVMLPKDFVRLCLTGEEATDVGDASGTLLLDVQNRRWSEKMLALGLIDRAMLPRVMESGALAGHVTAWAARETGLKAGTPVAAGTGDNMAAALGAGVVSPGDALAVLGTSGVILATTDRPRADLPGGRETPAGRIHSMAHAAGPGSWCVTGCTLSAGGALAWARDTIAPGVPFADLMAEAAAVDAGCDGLIFLPFLTGERCPYPDPAARGAWIGLSVRHTRAHMIRAVVEGVAITMDAILSIMRSIGVEVARVRLSGGGNRSGLWRSLQSDLFGVPVVHSDAGAGGSALGAAVLAGVGAGIFRDTLEGCGRLLSAGSAVITDPKPLAPGLSRARDAHRALYGALAPHFASAVRG